VRPPSPPDLRHHLVILLQFLRPSILHVVRVLSKCYQGAYVNICAIALFDVAVSLGVGWLGDRVGSRYALSLTLCGDIVFFTCTAFSTNVEMIMVVPCRLTLSNPS
jgi:MFS family permease